MAYDDPWIPRTKLGKMVKEGLVTSIDEIFMMRQRIQEVEIVDLLLPDLIDDVLSIKLVTAQSDAGRKRRFKATVAVGNKNGYIGVGSAKKRDIGPAIRQAIINAKINITPIRRGCGSWECSCGKAHTVPFKVTGKTGSTRIDLIPAPQGLGLVAGGTAKTVLTLAGISDVWSKTRGETRTTENFAMATWVALRNTYRYVVSSRRTKRIEEDI